MAVPLHDGTRDAFTQEDSHRAANGIVATRQRLVVMARHMLLHLS